MNSFQASLQKVREQNAALDTQIQTLRNEVGAERATKKRQAKVLADMRERDARQLAVLEGALGLRIEGVGGTCDALVARRVRSNHQKTACSSSSH